MDGRKVILCPAGHKLSVPTDKGTLAVTCPACRRKFDWSPGGNGGKGLRRRWVLWAGVPVGIAAAAWGYFAFGPQRGAGREDAAASRRAAEAGAGGAGGTGGAATQEVDVLAGAPAVTRQLLGMRAPGADWRKVVGDGPVGEGAEDTLRYWVGGRTWGAGSVSGEAGRERPKLDEAVRGRLLSAVEERPGYLARALGMLAEDEGSVGRVKGIYEREIAGKGEDIPAEEFGGWRERVHEWLVERGAFPEELVKLAQAARGEKGGVSGENFLAALARTNWAAAAEILKKNVGGADARLAAVSLAMLYEHDAKVKAEGAEEERKALVAMATDEKTGGFVRGRAIVALAGGDWEGRDAFIVGMFGDASLRKALAEEGGGSPLVMVVRGDPDYWIPRVAPLARSEDAGIRDGAVAALVQFNLEGARADALAPLLPWLLDDKWSKAAGRLRLIQSLSRVELTESVPGLVAVLGNEDVYARAAAAGALAHLKAKEAGPAVRSAFEKETSAMAMRELAKALIDCEGMSADEIVHGIETWARARAKGGEDGAAVAEGAVTDANREIVFGAYAVEFSAGRDDISEKAIERAEAMAGTEPAVSAALVECLQGSGSGGVDRYLARRLSGALDVATVRTSLARRERMRADGGVSSELQIIAKGQGESAGVTAALLEDGALEGGILRGKDAAAQGALLACARLGRETLPVEEVAGLLGHGGYVSAAAEKYLESEDSAAARRIVLGRHGGELLILGARMAIDPGHFTYAALDREEAALRNRMRGSTEVTELFALLSEGYWGGAGQRIIEKRADGTWLRLEPGGGKTRVRKLTDAELKQLDELVVTRKIDDLPALDQEVWDGVQFEYVHLTRQGGRRVFMNNPGSGASAGTVYETIADRFMTWSRSGTFATHYAVQDAVKGTEILWIADAGKWRAESVWCAGDDVRMLVGQGGAGAARDFEWRVFANGAVGEKAAEPVGAGAVGQRDDVPADFEIEWSRNRGRWQASVGGDVIRAGRTKGGRMGLWRCGKGKEPALICDGDFANAMSTPDGAWAVASRSDEGWAKPYSLVRVELSTGKVSEVDVGGRGANQAIAYVAGRGEFLVEREDREARTREYRLVDPANGKSQVVTGEFAPLRGMTWRFLQPTGGKAGEFWATLTDVEKHETVVGRYDAGKFVFRRVMALPGLEFSAMDMWVDEKAGHVDVAVNGDLLQVPLLPG